MKQLRFCYLRDSLRELRSFLFFSRAFLLCLMAGLVFKAAVMPALAISRQVNLSEMATSAGRVIHGRVAEVRSGTHPQYSHIAVTFVTLEALETIKGNTGRRVTFMQFGGAQANSRNFHLPQYQAGEEVVLFLYPESQYGFTSPVGEGQGKFLVNHDARTGRRALINDRGNRQLFEPLRNEKAMSRLKLNSAERALVAQEHGAADLDTFRSLVRKVVTNGAAINAQ